MENRRFTKGCHQVRFNGEFAEWLKENYKKKNIYQIMLKANEIYAESWGKYPETDEEWIQDLCLELLKVVEDKAWAEFEPEVKECQDLLAYMSICELNAPLVTDFLNN